MGLDTMRSDARAQSHMRMKLLYTNPTTRVGTPKFGGDTTSHVSERPE
jgi:hypothetical protein